MLRQGGHHVNSWSLSGSSVRPTIDEALGQQAIEERPFLRQLADDRVLALLRVHVDVAVRDVQVAAEHERAVPRAATRPACAMSASRNRIFAAKSLPPFGT